jgi:signal transduction histidine kinase/ActR/RegA family two-component response regulator
MSAYLPATDNERSWKILFHKMNCGADAMKNPTSDDSMLHRVFEASPSFLHVLSGPNFVFEYANDAYYRLVGRRDLIGRPAFEAMPEAAGNFPEVITAVMATRQPFHGHEIPVMLARTADTEPEERLIDLVYVPLIDTDGSCTRVLGHGTDVTESVRSRRRAEEAERLSFQRLTDALSAGRMIAWEWDVRTDVLTSRGAWLEIFNQEKPLFVTGRGAGAFLHPDDREARAGIVRAAVVSDTSWHMQYRALHPDGGIVWLEERATSCRDAATGDQVITGLVWDISSRKKAEEELQLADKRKNDFLATLSHELRNPLAPIRSGLQILKLLVPDDERVDRTRSIMERQMTHLVRLIDDLMEVSRISRGKIALRPRRLPLGLVLSTAIESAWPSIEAKAVKVERLLDDALMVNGDKDRLTQVFTNLLGNAVKFSPADSVIRLRMRREGNEAVVDVEDEGQGIDATSLETVFDLFAQGPSHQMSGSLGIGLALVKQLVELHQGTITARSDGKDRGSTFTVRLPLAVPDPGTQDIAERDDPVRTPKPTHLRILVVDDNHDAADTLVTCLKLEGYTADVVYGGLEAVDAFERTNPDLVLLDIGMPGVDGYEAARRIRNSASGKSARLVALTGWGQPEDKAKVLAAGFDAHLTKPVDLAALANAMKGASEATAIRSAADPAG